MYSTVGFEKLVGERLCGLKTCLFLLFVLFVTAWPSRAGAHAALLGSDPVAGALLEKAPREVTLRFNEPVSPLVLVLARPDGSTLRLGQESTYAPDIDDSVESSVRVIENGLSVLLPRQDEPGAYALSWRIVSADGHPVGGTLVFSVGMTKELLQDGDGAVQRLAVRDVVIWLLRFGWYVGLLIGVGTVAFHAWQGTRPGRYPIALLALSVPVSLLNLGLLGVDALDMPLSGLWQRDAWLVGAGTSYGLATIFTLLSLFCAGLCLLAPPSSLLSRMLAVAAVMLSGMSLASSGHASSAPPSWLARPAVFSHGLAVILWIGALWPLIQACRPSGDSSFLRRFSTIIPGVLTVLLASGAVLVYLQFDRFSSLWQTAYGRVLFIKLILLMLLLGLAALNRYRLTSGVFAGSRRASATMRSIIRMELTLAVLILAVVAVWRFTPPPRSLAQQSTLQQASSRQTVSMHIDAEQGMADLSLTPPRAVSPGSLTLFLSMPDLSPLPAQQVDVVFWSSDAGIQPLSFSAVPFEDGTWRVDEISLPDLPHWNIRVDALISDFERISLGARLELP